MRKLCQVFCNYLGSLGGAGLEGIYKTNSNAKKQQPLEVSCGRSLVPRPRGDCNKGSSLYHHLFLVSLHLLRVSFFKFQALQHVHACRCTLFSAP